MSNLNDLINLAKADGGKFFIMDEQGDAKLVIMSVEDYQGLLLGKLQRQVTDVEEINQEILKVQLSDNQNFEPKAQVKSPNVKNYPEVSKNDLRAEVIDPSFDFEGPMGDIDDL